MSSFQICSTNFIP